MTDEATDEIIVIVIAIRHPHAGLNTPMPDSGRRPGKNCRVIMVNKTFLPIPQQPPQTSNRL
jgi:hypothetical protein